MAYWWLNTNRKIWSFDKISEGAEEPFLLQNPDGGFRNYQKNFVAIKKNDLIIGYESSPTKQIVALCACSWPSDGKSIGVKKITHLRNPVCISEIETNKDLQEMQFLKAIPL